MRMIENRPGKCAGRLCLRLSQDDWQVEVIVSLHIERRRRRGRIAYNILRRYGNGVRAKRQHSRRHVNQLSRSSNKSRGNNLPIQPHLHRGWVDAYSGVCDQRADDRQRVGNSGTVRGSDARNLWRRNIIAERKCAQLSDTRGHLVICSGLAFVLQRDCQLFPLSFQRNIPMRLLSFPVAASLV
jgi:hypothetical protein